MPEQRRNAAKRRAVNPPLTSRTCDNPSHVELTQQPLREKSGPRFLKSAGNWWYQSVCCLLSSGEGERASLRAVVFQGFPADGRPARWRAGRLSFRGTTGQCDILRKKQSFSLIRGADRVVFSQMFGVAPTTSKLPEGAPNPSDKPQRVDCNPGLSGVFPL